MTDRAAIAIIIPALNEAQTITPVIQGVAPYGQVIVVDDGSHDETAQIATAHGAIVVSHAHNLGYDMALYSGLSKALEIGADIAITIDADGQHKPQDVARFIAHFKTQSVDLVLGYRPKAARISEWVFRQWVRGVYGVRDILCGLKAYRISALRPHIEYARTETVGTGLAIAMMRGGAKIAQLPIEVQDRADIPRIGRAFRANLLIFRAMMRAMKA